MSMWMISIPDLLKLHKTELDKVKEIFSKFDGKISLSLDIQKEFVQFEDYVCLSAHFIDKDWELQKWVIKYCAWNTFESDHPTVVTLKSLNEYDIEGKLLTLTLIDYYDEMAKEVKEGLRLKGNLVLADHFFHVQACSDVICEMMEKGFKEIDRIIDKVQLLSWSKSMPLWYLTTHKLSEALKLEEMGEFSSVEEDGFYEVSSKEEWEKVRKMCKIADRIYQVTKGLFKVKNPTSNLFLPTLQEIRSYLTDESVSSDEFVKQVALKMLEIFNKYWDDMFLVLSIAAFFDPRYKMKFVEQCMSDNSTRATIVSNTIHKLYDDEYALQCGQMEHSTDTSSEVKAMNSLNDSAQKSDMDLYLEEPVLPWTKNFSVLQWWKGNCSKYPRLSRMARDFLAIPMSLATREAAYNIEPREAKLTLQHYKPEVMNALKCIGSWKLDPS